MRLRSKLAALTVTAAVAVTATAAYAWWSTDGSGTGDATVAGDYAARIIVNQDSDVSDLVPGGDPQTLSGDFTNNNEGSVSIQSVTAVVAGTHRLDLEGNEVQELGCDANDFNVSAVTVSQPLISAGQTEGAWSATISMKDRENDDQNACKGVIVDLAYTSN